VGEDPFLDQWVATVANGVLDVGDRVEFVFGLGDGEGLLDVLVG